MSCSLTPDGGRAHKVAGKNRTAREVKVMSEILGYSLQAIANYILISGAQVGAIRRPWCWEHGLPRSLCRHLKLLFSGVAKDHK